MEANNDKPAQQQPAVNPDLINQLELMLRDAKAGNLMAMAATCWISPGVWYMRVVAGSEHLSDLHSGLSLICDRIRKGWADNIDRQIQEAAQRVSGKGLVRAAQATSFVPDDIRKMFKQ